MTNWPEKYNIHPPYTGAELAEPNSRNIQFQYGCNFACDAYRAALNEACSQEELENFINDWLSKRHGFKYVRILSRDLSDAIRKHLGIEDSKEGESNAT